MKFCSHSTTHVGKNSSSNQDAVLIDQDLGVYIVCDGMGGTSGGATAATLASQAALDYLREHTAELKKISDGESSPHMLVELAQAAVQAANSRVHSYMQLHAEMRGAGTTIALLLTAGTSAACAHVGDSQVFIYREKKLIQLTKDHSLAQDLLDSGKLDRSQLQTFPFRHVLSRAVGILAAVRVDTLLLEVLPTDRFLLITGGISNHLGSTVLGELLSGEGPQHIPDRLVSQTRESGNSESFSVIVVEAMASSEDFDKHMARAAELIMSTNLLQEVFLFKELDSQSILRLVNASTVVDCVAGSTLVRQGEIETSLYVILDGGFDIVLDGHTIARLTRGNHFGEMSLLTSHPRSATVCAATDGKALRITSDYLQKFIFAHPQEGVRMMITLARELSERLRNTNQIHTVSMRRQDLAKM